MAAIGFGLLLGAGFALSGGAVGWRRGLLWGAAGFAIFALAPALGLPPELPGAEAAPLAARQGWWLATVLATGGGLALLVFDRRLALKGLAIVLIVLPHLLGAPQPEQHGGLAPAELARAFVAASLFTSALLWLVLGAVSGLAFERLGKASA